MILSIVIPTFNCEKTISPLLKSINSSRFKHFKDIEVIIVDDGSLDETINILDKSSENFIPPIAGSNFKLNHKGPAYARNYGVKKAKGKYILFLDGDVILKKDTLSKVYDFFKDKKGLAVTGIWDKKQKTGRFFPQYKALRDHAYWFAERELNSRYYLFSTRIAGIEKKLFQKIGGFNTSYKKPTVEDIELTYKIEKHSPIYFDPEIVVEHEFEDFPVLAKKYFFRSRDWIKLYLRRLRFDPVATSRREANKSIIVGLFILFLFLYLLTFWPLYLYLYLGFFAIFLGMEFNFLTFLFREKGFRFTLIAIPTSIILYLIIDAGSFIGLLEYFFISKNSKD